MADKKIVKKGDHVAWNTPQGETQGHVTKKENDKKFEVKSDKSGKKAEHTSDALNKK